MDTTDFTRPIDKLTWIVIAVVFYTLAFIVSIDEDHNGIPDILEGHFHLQSFEKSLNTILEVLSAAHPAP